MLKTHPGDVLMPICSDMKPLIWPSLPSCYILPNRLCSTTLEAQLRQGEMDYLHTGQSYLCEIIQCYLCFPLLKKMAFLSNRAGGALNVSCPPILKWFLTTSSTTCIKTHSFSISPMHLKFLLANASCTRDHPGKTAFYPSHKRQTSRWFPGHPPNLKGSHLGQEEEARGLEKAPVLKGSGLLSAGEDWCKGTRWATES